MIDLAEKHKKMVNSILASVPHHQFYVFGSRVKGTAKPFSDLDLAVNDVLSTRERSQLEMLFEESDLPFKVDIIELPKISGSFKEHITPDLVLWEK